MKWSIICYLLAANQMWCGINWLHPGKYSSQDLNKGLSKYEAGMLIKMSSFFTCIRCDNIFASYKADRDVIFIIFMCGYDITKSRLPCIKINMAATETKFLVTNVINGKLRR